MVPVDPRVAIVAAVARNGVIGRANALPWHLAEDLQRFKRLTMGAPVIMGRKTHDAIGKPLPGRVNIVVSRSPSLAAPGCMAATSLEEAIAMAGEVSRIFVIGGAQLYEQALPFAATMYLTEIEADFDGDTQFPRFERAHWSEVSRDSRFSSLNPRVRYAFVEYARTKR